MPRILVVDDDQLVRTAIELCLRRAGHEVVVADGGEAGMRELKSQAFDVMLVDIFMPRMRGFESIRLFHECAPQVPLVAISGYSFAALETPGVDLERMAVDLGAARCLRKPFSPQMLLAVIAECLVTSASPAQRRPA
jgi:CheY-like chemotaxis protein